MFYTIQGTPIGKVQTLSQKKRQKENLDKKRRIVWSIEMQGKWIRCKLEPKREVLNFEEVAISSFVDSKNWILYYMHALRESGVGSEWRRWYIKWVVTVECGAWKVMTPQK